LGCPSATSAQPLRLLRSAPVFDSAFDLVREDYKDLSGRVGKQDQQKLDEYISSVRDIETRLERAAKMPEVKVPDGVARPAGIPASYEEHIKLMGDLLTLAFQTDVTRVTTFVVANEGSNKPYAFVGVPEGHHDLSHHQNNQEKMAKVVKINTYNSVLFAKFLAKLQSTNDGPGSLLDNSLIVYGAGMGDSNGHATDPLPVALLSGSLKGHRHIELARRTPVGNLWRSVAARFDTPIEQFGDSTGTVDEVF